MKPDNKKEEGEGYEAPSERDRLVEFLEKEKDQAWTQYALTEVANRTLESQSLTTDKNDGKRNSELERNLKGVKSEKELFALKLRHLAAVIKELSEDKFEI